MHNSVTAGISENNMLLALGRFFTMLYFLEYPIYRRRV